MTLLLNSLTANFLWILFLIRENEKSHTMIVLTGYSFLRQPAIVWAFSKYLKNTKCIHYVFGHIPPSTATRPATICRASHGV